MNSTRVPRGLNLLHGDAKPGKPQPWGEWIPLPSLSVACPPHPWLSQTTATLTINAGAPARLPPIAVKLKGETAATKPCGWERKGTGGCPQKQGVWGKERESEKQRAAPHLQPPVHHAVGADVHADGLVALQLQRILGIESEEVDQLGSGIDFCLDDCFTLRGEVASNKGTNMSNKSTKRRVFGGCSNVRCSTAHAVDHVLSPHPTTAPWHQAETNAACACARGHRVRPCRASPFPCCKENP